jgi:hypothetical protein
MVFPLLGLLRFLWLRFFRCRARFAVFFNNIMKTSKLFSAMMVAALMNAGAIAAQVAAPAVAPSPATTGSAVAAEKPAGSQAPVVSVSATNLIPQPAAGAVALPAAADELLHGYGSQAQQSLILTYFAAGTLADALAAGAVSGDDGRKQADSYLALATQARDELKRVRATYVLGAVDLDLLDKLAVAYEDVIPMIESAQKLAETPKDAEKRAATEAARRRAFLTLSAIFGWK